MNFLSEMENLVLEREEVAIQRIQLDRKEKEIIKQQEELLKQNFSFVAQVKTAWDIEETVGDNLTVIFVRTEMYYEDDTVVHLIASDELEAIEATLPAQGYKNVHWLK